MTVSWLRSSRTWVLCAVIAGAFAAGLEPIHAQLRGHGGAVRALAISADGLHAISGSFDTSAIRWSLSRNVAEQVMRFHDGPVNAVALLNDGRIVTAGGDAHIAIWTAGKQSPDRVLDGHAGPIAALAVSRDGKTLASASWDRTVRLWPLAGGLSRVLEGNGQNVNGVAFSPDGTAVISAGYDGTIRVWQTAGDGVSVHNLPSPLNSVVIAPNGDIIAAGASGKVFFLSSAGELLAAVEAGTTPIIQLAISNDARLVAAATTRGSVAVIDRSRRRLMHTLVGPGLPVWSVAFMPDNATLLTGGTDAGMPSPASRSIRRWLAPRRTRSSNMPAITGPKYFAPALRVTRLGLTRVRRRVRRFGTFSAVVSLRYRDIISRPV